MCRKYKSGNRCIHGNNCLCRHADGDPAESWTNEIERFGGTHLKFSGCTWYKIEFGKEKGQKGEPRERNPCAPHFEERTLEETSRQEEHARKPAWNLTSKICKLKAEDRATFCFCVKLKAPVLVSQNTEERMFVVDSGASMHMLSKKDLSSDEMNTLRRSRTSTTVMSANGEVQTNEEAQVYVHDLYLFVTVQVLEETPAVLSLAKLCSELGCSYEWNNGETQDHRISQNLLVNPKHQQIQ